MSIENQKESRLEKATSQEVDLFYKYISKDDKIKYIEIDKNKVSYILNGHTCEVTFKVKINE